ncbi:MAG: MurR/RpiR family transcriptional regulator [Bacillota bacterium]
MSFEELAETVRSRFPVLSPEFRRAARFLTDHPDEVAVSSMREVARRAGVKPPTLVRFAQSLEFPGWPGLREVVVERFRADSAYATRARAIVKRGAASQLASDVFGAQRRDIEATESQSAALLPRVAKLLRDARTVHVAGFRASHAIAFGFAYLYRLFRPSVSLVVAEGGTLEMELRAIQPKDAVVVVSFAPYSREARLVAEAAKRVKCKLVAITDSLLAPIALAADETLLFTATSPSFFPSIVGGVSVAESLLGVIVAREGKRIVERIESAERQLFDLGSYEMAARERRKKT